MRRFAAPLIEARTFPWPAGLRSAAVRPSSGRFGPDPGVEAWRMSPEPNRRSFARTFARRRASMRRAETVIVPLKLRLIIRTNRRRVTAREKAERPSAR